MKIRYFVFGFFTYWALLSLNQDMLGKEKYLKLVETGWVDAKITVPIALLVLITFAVLALIDKAREQK